MLKSFQFYVLYLKILFIYLSKSVKSKSIKKMFAEKIRQLREEKQLLQRQISASLDIDNALYCKIERGDRKAKREQVVELARIFDVDENELLGLWLADKVYGIIKEENNVKEVLNIVADNIVEYLTEIK